MNRAQPGTRHALNLTLAVITLVAIAGGIVALRTATWAQTQRDRYIGAARCASDAAATNVPPTCWVKTPARVIGRFTDRHIGVPRYQLAVRYDRGAAQTIEVLSIATFDATQPGDAVQVKTWGGVITAIYTDRGILPTPANPTVDDPLPTIGGASLIALGAAVLLLIPWRRSAVLPHSGTPHRTQPAPSAPT